MFHPADEQRYNGDDSKQPCRPKHSVVRCFALEILEGGKKDKQRPKIEPETSGLFRRALGCVAHLSGVHQDQPYGKDYGQHNPPRAETFFQPESRKDSAENNAGFAQSRKPRNRSEREGV